jgi:hypothetical protein
MFEARDAMKATNQALTRRSFSELLTMAKPSNEKEMSDGHRERASLGVRRF